jgi:hypothetical protein
MIWIPDRTKRFPVRPHYELYEMDQQAEQLITQFLLERYGQAGFPMATRAVEELLDRETNKTNFYCDLSDEGEDVEGLTEFFPGHKPNASIARELSYQRWRENRYRFTVLHEYVHVHWHAPLFDRFCERHERHKCARGKILPASNERDWMEFQAAYMAGALLMPKGRVDLNVRTILAGFSLESPLTAQTVERTVLIQRTAELFGVSDDAAEVRLWYLGHLL